MLRNYEVNLHNRVPAWALSYKFNACSFHYTINCAALFSYLTAKDCYRLLEFLNYTLVHMQPDILNIGTFKMFIQSFKNIKPEVLNATSLTR